MLDWRRLPLRLAATLAAGLGEDSRSRRALAGGVPPSQAILLATIADGVNTLIWMFGFEKGAARPPSIRDKLLNIGDEPEEPESEYRGFDTAEELQAALYPENPNHTAYSSK